MKRLAFALALTAALPAVAAPDRQQLVRECQRGFADSCRMLRLQNADVGGSPPVSRSARSQLETECLHGYAASCEALRAVNGEQPRTERVCSESGGTYSGAYRGNVVCRDVRE